MDVSQYILQFIRLSFPSNTEEITLQNYKTYLLKVLNARLCSPILEEQELQSELARFPNKNSAYRLQECLNRLSKQKLKKKNEITHFLFRVGQFANKEQNQTMDTLFQTQDISTSQINLSQSSINQIKKQVMEVENPLPNTRRNEPTSGLLQLIESIADKGNVNISISEMDLVKDLVFCIQGIEGQYIAFDPIADTFQAKKDIALSIPSRKLINILCECGWLFKKIQTFQSTQSQSLVVQALQNANKEELNEYYRLIAYFEGLIQQEGAQKLTLRKMYMWLKQPMHYLTQINLTLSLIQSNSNLGSTSALILSTLYQYSKHGCPTTSDLFKRQLQATCIPIIRFINQWVFDGTLDDVVGEFFVIREESKIPIRDSGELWKREFKLSEDKIPNLISFEDAHKIYDTGRVVNWLRKQCQYRKWHLDQELVTIEMLQTPLFSDWVKKANEATNQELVQLIFNQFKFNLHLNAIKRYLLLGQGEFIHTLMEILQVELSKPAINVYRHTLLGLLESAIRQSNIQNLPQEVGLRLNVKLLEPSKDDSGWEVFCLDYHIDEPLNTIFNGRVMLFYYRIFNFLWRVKRVEYTLSQCWKTHVKFIRIPKELTQLKKAMQLSHQMLNEMQHFIKNFYSYVMLEAVESSWKKFVDECEKIKDLDSLIKLHESFQTEVLERAFLTQKTEQIQKSLLKLFELIFRFKSMQESLLSVAKDIIEVFKSDEVSLQLKHLLGNRQQQIESNKSQFKGAEVIRSLLELRKHYREQMQELLEKLKREDRLKFLLFKLDFNEYYKGISEYKFFDVDLDKFIGMCLPKQDTNTSARIQSQKQITNNSAIKAQQPIATNQRSQTNILPQKEYIDQVRQVKEGLKMLDEQRKSMLQQKTQQITSPPISQLPPQPPMKTQTKVVQQFQQSQLSQQSQQSQMPLQLPQQQQQQRFTLTDYEKQKNDENLDSSSSDDIKLYQNRNQFRDDNDDDEDDDDKLI